MMWSSKRRVLALAALGSLATSLWTPRDASAQGMELLDLVCVERGKAGEKKGKKGPKKSPYIFRAVVATSIGGLSADKFQLKEDNPEAPVVVKAERAVPYNQSDEPLALVVLIQGDERWMGNETYEEDEDNLSPGAFTGLGAALDALQKAGPPGSKAVVLAYRGGKPVEKMPLGPLSELSGTVLGQQKDYEGIGVPLIPGITSAATMLANMGSYRKVLVIMGDGTGQQEDIAPQLKEPLRLLKSSKVETFTIHFEAIPNPNQVGKAVMGKLGYSGKFSATSKDNFVSFGETIVKKINARYYVDFPAMPFSMDGLEHDMILTLDKEESDPKTVLHKKFKKPSKGGGGSLWWLWFIVLPIVLIGALIIFLKKRSPAPAPMPVIEEAPAAPEAGPAKTIMLGVGGNDEGMPIVGWIVPLTGANQFQTFKLLQGVTKIGTDGDVHIIINDTFMSTSHAEIVCSPVGFMLNDAGSTNGTFVNQKRISQHELVDNDVFTLGKTDFKFKSIN